MSSRVDRPDVLFFVTLVKKRVLVFCVPCYFPAWCEVTRDAVRHLPNPLQRNVW